MSSMLRAFVLEQVQVGGAYVQGGSLQHRMGTCKKSCLMNTQGAS